MQPTLCPDDEIVLHVGGHRFHTTRATLIDGSDFFAAQFSGKWKYPSSGNGSYFLDANPKLFEHILAFLRRKVLPIFWDSLQGFDHALYKELRIEADYLSVQPLANWIRQKSYLDTIRQEISLTTITHKSEDLAEEATRSIQAEPDTELSFHFSSGFRTIYRCPRNISKHDDNFEGCGRQCKEVKAKKEPRAVPA